ncbi:MAG: cold shock domain-containing protein [Pseudomonadota bacterium]
MRSTGRISKWKDDKGFGFIVPDGGGDELFAHISEVNAEGRRPSAGDRVSYAVGTDRAGRRCARQVLLDGVPLKTARPRARASGDDHPAQGAAPRCSSFRPFSWSCWSRPGCGRCRPAGSCSISA